VLAVRRGHPRLGADTGAAGDAGSAGASLDLFCELPHVILGYGSSMLDDSIDAELARVGRRRLAQLAVTTFSQMVDVLARTDHVAVLPQRVALGLGARLSLHPLPLPLPDYRVYVCMGPRLDSDAGAVWLKERVERIFAAHRPDGACADAR
jgi:DNA-binding transcriptional LysR family regulator